MQLHDSCWGIAKGIEPDLSNLDLSMVRYSYDFHQVVGKSSNGSHQVHASGLAFDYDPSYKNKGVFNFLPSQREVSVPHFYIEKNMVSLKQNKIAIFAVIL